MAQVCHPPTRLINRFPEPILRPAAYLWSFRYIKRTVLWLFSCFTH